VGKRSFTTLYGLRNYGALFCPRCLELAARFVRRRSLPCHSTSDRAAPVPREHLRRAGPGVPRGAPLWGVHGSLVSPLPLSAPAAAPCAALGGSAHTQRVPLSQEWGHGSIRAGDGHRVVTPLSSGLQGSPLTGETCGRSQRSPPKSETRSCCPVPWEGRDMRRIGCLLLGLLLILSTTSTDGFARAG